MVFYFNYFSTVFVIREVGCLEIPIHLSPYSKELKVFYPWTSDKGLLLKVFVQNNVSEFNKYHTRTKTTDEAVFLRVTDKALATPTSNLYHCLNSIVID